MPAIRRVAHDAPAVALPLDEIRDVARHLPEEQAHRDVGEREAENEGESERDENGDECEE